MASHIEGDLEDVLSYKYKINDLAEYTLGKFKSILSEVKNGGSTGDDIVDNYLLGYREVFLDSEKGEELVSRLTGAVNEINKLRDLREQLENHRGEYIIISESTLGPMIHSGDNPEYHNARDTYYGIIPEEGDVLLIEDKDENGCGQIKINTNGEHIYFKTIHSPLHEDWDPIKDKGDIKYSSYNNYSIEFKTKAEVEP